MPCTTSSEEIRARVLEALRVTHHIYSRVLNLLDIETTREVPTAAVTLGGRSVLRVNPDFVARHCPTDASLAMLVLHELTHILMGHTRLWPRITPAQNIAFDAVINADLCRLFPGPESTALFRSCYAPDRLPEALLRPPEGWSSGSPRWVLQGRAGEVHRALYGSGEVTTIELLRLVEELVATAPGKPAAAGRAGDGEAGGERDRGPGGTREEENRQGPGGAREDDAGLDVGRLLGNHGPEEAGGDPSPEVLREIREIVAQWPREQRGFGRGAGGYCQSLAISLAPSPSALAVAILRRALLSVARENGEDGQARRRATGEREALLPLRSSRDRRGLVLEAAGHAPPLWTVPVVDRADRYVTRAHAYLDVSGSMEAVLPLVYRALVLLSSLVSPRVFLFSTEVHEIPVAALRRGKVVSTGGTSISCVTEHMISRRIRRAVVITDGLVGRVPEEHRHALRKARIAAVVTTPGQTSFAGELGARLFVLPRLP